jgi:predicted MFS family arabinose efflux permease
MSGPRRTAALFLLGGVLLASGVPALLGYTVPRLNAITLRDPRLLVWQMLPYLLCGALWLPWHGRFAERAGRIVAGVLLGVSVAIYVPLLLHPGWISGDMVGLAFIILTLSVSAGVVVVTLGVWIARLLRMRGGSREGPAKA